MTNNNKTNMNTASEPFAETWTNSWSDSQRYNFGQSYHLSEHSLHKTSLFTRKEIISLLDSLPKKQIQCYTMESLADGKDSIQAVDPDHCSGKAMFHAIENGLFWFNLKQLECHDKRYADLLNSMFTELRKNCPHLLHATDISCDLLITSAKAHTHYHIDRGPSILWNLSGKKRVWVYPDMDFKFIKQEEMEEIFAGERLEYLHYDSTFDEHAQYCELEPGEMVAWRNSAPHRVENIDMCVSLVCSYSTPESIRRTNIQRANHFLLKPAGISVRSSLEKGILCEAKEFTFRALNKAIHFKPKDNFRENYKTCLRIDESSKSQVSHHEVAVMPKFLSR